MKNQYVGDINDYRKYDLLELLSKELNKKILVVWMLTPDDEKKSDGKKIKYFKYPQKWKNYNEELFECLIKIVDGKKRDVEEIQKWLKQKSDFEFHSDPIENDIQKRKEYFDNVRKKAENVQIVFFDPDNGIVPQENKYNKNAEKYLFWDEIEKLWNAKKDILIFQYFPWYCNRKKYVETKIDDCATKLCIDKDNIIAFNAKSVVYLFLTHTITDKKKKKLESEWSKWEDFATYIKMKNAL
jgi:hypothetical protein